MESTGVKGGIVVHLGCGDGKLTTALRQNDLYLVQGLESDQALIQSARKYVSDQGLYGPVSIEFFNGSKLPYADNLINLFVAEDTVTGAPRRLQWAANPLWLRSHETPSGFQALVTAGGRVFISSTKA